MNYEESVKTVRRSAIAVASAHLALIVLDVSIMASSLPNVYVSDLAANCGARYLVKLASDRILESGVAVIAALAVALLYAGWISGRNLTYKVVGYMGQAFQAAIVAYFGLLSILFFLSAISQLTRLGHPPSLPEDFQKTHVCPALPEAP